MLAMCILAITLVTGINAVDCPSGNAAGFMKDGMTCTELTDARNYECYNSVIETQCCESCNNISGTNSGDCLYGDRQSGCFFFACPTLVNISDCCETCASLMTTPSSSTSTTSTTSTTMTITSSTTSSISTSTSTSTTSPMTSLPLTSTSSGVPDSPNTTSTTSLSKAQRIHSTLTSYSILSQARSSSSAASLSALFTAAPNTTSSTGPSATTSLSVASSSVTSVSPNAQSAYASSAALFSTQPMQSTSDDNVAAIVGGVIGGLAGVSLIVAAIFAAIKLKKCCKRKVSTSDHSTTSINKVSLIPTCHHTANPDPRIIKETLDNGQPYSIVVNENNINSGFKDDPDTKSSETIPPPHNTDTNASSVLPNGKFDMPNYATDFDKLNETLTTQEISYLVTIDPPTLVELDVPQSVDKGIHGCQDDPFSHNNELEWEVSSYINESENTPATRLTGGFTIVNVTFNEA